MLRETAVPSDSLQQTFERALARHQSGQAAEAERLYRQVLNALPRHVEARHYLGILRFQQGRHREALELIGAALAVRPNYAEARYNRGNILSQLERYEEAIADYDAALAIDPGYFEAHHNRGNALFMLRRFEEALASHDRALAIRPDYLEALNSRGTVLTCLRRDDEALATYDRALAIRPNDPDTLYSRGNVLKELKRFELSLTSYEMARALKPDHPDRFGAVDCALSICDFDRTGRVAEGLSKDILAGKASVPPMTLVRLCDEPALHLRCAENFFADRVPVRPPALSSGAPVRRDIIRLAYLSADFHDHVTAFLMAELFELHDRSRFELHAFSFGRDSDSPVRRRLVASFDQFHDVRDRDDGSIARKLREHDIDIAIDLKGHTKDSRPGILAYRAAPIQAGYLGYPGTIGADVLDYIIADPVVLPFDQQRFYREKIVHLPDSYQVNDRNRAIAERTPTRQEAGLPDAGFVFCCFNNNFKIRKPVFEAWMRLLTAVPGSVLWLLRDNPSAERNLRSEAAARGVNPARLIFAERCNLDDHLARHRLADLFLDTLPYNAHTTASDALWTGLPVVTCQGAAFAGRVGASLLQAAGLGELVTHSLDDYEALALRLAGDAAMLGTVRDKLARSRLACPLFDTDRFRRHIETAYTTMWEIWQRGEPPRSFAVETSAPARNAL